MATKEPEYKVSTVNSYDCFLKLEEDWESLTAMSASGMPFDSFEWYKHWWKHFASQFEMNLILIYSVTDSVRQLACAFPLMRDAANSHENDWKIWANTHSFRVGLLCHSDHLAALNMLAVYLSAQRHWREIYIPYLSTEDAVHKQFKCCLMAAGLKIITRPGMVSPWLNTVGEFEALVQSASKSRRETLRRKVKKLLSNSHGRVEITLGRVGEMDKKLRDCWQISAHTWKHKEGSSIASDPARVAFYEAIANSDYNWIFLAVLYIQDSPVAFEYNLLYRDTLFNLKLGYDEHYSKQSPGLVLRMKVLEWAFEHPDVLKFDYMGVEADYKKLFSTGSTGHEYLTVYNNSLASLPRYFLYGRLIPKAKNVLRPIKRRIFSSV